MINSYLLRQARKRNEFGYPEGSYTPAIIAGIAFLVFLTIVALEAHRSPANGIVKASWYSLNDHTYAWRHTTTANGEVFDENALTAASWLYPMNTRLKVTNVANGKSVIVRINDHGPSKRLVRKGRIIDLSRGAFARIADLNSGVIQVSIEEVKVHGT